MVDPEIHETDALAVALEEVGFDVGRAFPMLSATRDHSGAPVVQVGRIAPHVAARLAAVLSRAARNGITLQD